MRALPFLLLLVTVSGCQKNRELLHARQEELNRQLAEAMEIADTLNDERRAIAALEARVKAGLDEVPAAREAIGAIEAQPVVATVPPPLTPLPPQSAFEGSEGARRRLQIAETEQRLAQLQKIVGEAYRLRPQKTRLQRQLEVIEGLRQQPK